LKSFSDSVLVFEEVDGDLKLARTELQLEHGSGPKPRGWTAGTRLGKNRFAVFGGLTGDDEKPERLDDLWICDFSQDH
jgi:hypothetical protein